MRRLVLVLVLMGVGCTACIPQAVQDQAAIEAKIHDQVWKRWDNLTPGQRRQAYWASRRGWHAAKVGVGIGGLEGVPPERMPVGP